MGSTLEHGIYLPSEGEKNCYQGLAGNWNKVDGALGDVAGLKQLIESKFTKEIVTELPTEDINPYCIYMILKTDPETNNIYDEWVYINNAWEYLGNTQVDMTQYYTKQEVNELPAVASGVTSTKVGNYDAHIANGDIHVTASDKAKWNTVALIKQLRLVNAQVGSATTIAFANIDDTNGIKVGDKCMDLNGKMFEITAVDTTNETVTVGSALIDLAQDSDVVHKSGNETISGFKNFENIRLTNSIRAIALDDQTADINDCYSSFAQPNSPKNGNVALYSCNTDVSTANITNLPEPKAFYLISITIRYLSNTPTVKQILFTRENIKYERFCNTGTWSNWVKDTDKFVTTDTAQTISGAKTFTDNNMIKTSSPKVLLINTSQTGNTAPSSNTASFLRFDGGTVNNFGGVQCEFLTTGENRLTNYVNDITKAKVNTIQQRANSTTAMTVFNADLLAPATDGVTALGSSSKRWSDCQTKLINGLTPSSLSLPDLNSGVDISSYITVVNNANKESLYTPPANGWVCVRLSRTSGALGVLLIQGDLAISGKNVEVESGVTTADATIPVIGGVQVSINSALADGVVSAKFFPCLGNV